MNDCPPMTTALTVPLPTVAPWYDPTTEYDPRTEGADCDHCPMRRWRREKWAPVPAQRAKRHGRVVAPQFAAIGECPAANDETAGETFVGESGKEFNATLARVGVARMDLDVDNVVACRAPKDKYDLIAVMLKRDKTKGRSPDYENHPATHCRPRFERTLARTNRLVPMGAKALSALMGGAQSILAVRGGPVGAVDRGMQGGYSLFDGDNKVAPIRILPTVHPAFVRRSRRWRTVATADLRRAVRFFKGDLRWKDTLITLQPTPAQLESFLALGSKFWTYDTETNAKEPLRAVTRCISICRDATPDEVAQGYEDACVGIVLRHTDNEGEDTVPHYSEAMKAQIITIVQRAFRDGRLWAGWNSGWYDLLTVEKPVYLGGLGAIPEPHMDGIMLRSVGPYSELGKSLGIVGSIHTDVSAWKQDNEGKKLASLDTLPDVDRVVYCCTDTAVNRRVMYPLVADVVHTGADKPTFARPDKSLSQIAHSIQGFCAGLTRTGMLIDPEEQRQQNDGLEREVAYLGERVVREAEALGFTNFNPRSHPQVRALLYSDKGFGLEPTIYTDMGDPSTNDASMRAHLMDAYTPEEALSWLRWMRLYRNRHKRLTTFVRPLCPYGTTFFTDSGEERPSVLDSDGRLHVAWSAHPIVTGRLSSNSPMNATAFPKMCRRMIKAAPGNVLVGADFDQLEGRVAAARWGMKAYLKAFHDPTIDAHQITMEFTMEDRIWKMRGAPPAAIDAAMKFRKKWEADPQGRWAAGTIGGQFDAARTLNKRYYYLKLYRGGDETVWTMLREVEEESYRPVCSNCGKDGAGRDAAVKGCALCFLSTEFIYKDLKLAAIEEMSERFAHNSPELKRGWEAEDSHFQATGGPSADGEPAGWTGEPLTGRRRYFLDGYDPNEVANYAIQSSAAALTNLATLKLMEMGYVSNFAGPGTGPIQQGHDALVLEVPEAMAEKARVDLENAMTQHYPEVYDVQFTAEAEIGQRWSEV